jgi:copper homeostasis protein
MSKGARLLEVIACSVADAVEAEQGGAGRLEIVSDLSRGGMTPPVALVEQIVSAVTIPVRVMLRESDGYEVKNGAEKDRLCNAARHLSKLGIDGLVLGFVRSGNVDVRLTQKLLACAPSLRATFHHAFEELDPMLAIPQIREIKQVDRILTYGGAGSWSTKVENLLRYQQQAGPEIKIIAGGGLDAEKIADLASKTLISEFHVGRAARVSDDVNSQVNASRVKELLAAF